jgi:hypothetical protein
MRVLERAAPLCWLLVLAGCAPAAEQPAGAAADPAAIVARFDCFAANSAWGYTLSGTVVDANGTIWRYGRRGEAWLPQIERAGSDTFVSAQDLRTKFAQARVVGSVAADVLRQKSALIAPAAAGAITRADTGVRDAGTSVCHAYVEDAAHARFRDVELGSDGGVADERVANAAAEAAQLLDWLRSIGVAR